MSAAIASSGAAVATHHDTHTAVVTHESGNEQDSYALWKSVFERARPSEVTADDARKSAMGDFVQPTPRFVPASVVNEPFTQAQSTLSPSATADVNLAGAARTSSHDAVSIRAGADDRRVRAVHVAASDQVHRAGERAEHMVREETSRTARTVLWNAAATSRTGSTETVTVLVQGKAVSIVVRDTLLSDEEAMRCAFETARELTGEHSALQGVTLNGRTLYQQGRALDDGAASVLFVC